ncbi:MAG: lytic transglycosylase domain-containing protein [Ilumatobacteraceae bacterium]|nr:lytic transglycosylase domain-containing protein [Ilumatobacteraceae bacterium]
MRASFLSDFDISTYQSGLRNTLGTDGKPLGNKGAWDQVVSTLTDARKGGLLSATDLEQIKNQIIPEGAPGAGKRYGDFYKARFGEIERAVRQQTQTDYNLGQQEKQRQMKEFEDQMLDSFLDPNDADGFSDDQLEQAQETYMRFSGGRRSTRLDNLKKLTVNSETRKDQEKFVEGLISQGMLTEAELNKLDPDIQRKYRSTAQQQQKALQANGNNQVQLDAIKDRIEQKAGYSPMGKKHFTMGLKIAQEQNKFRQKYGAYMASGTMTPEAAANAALNDVLTNFETNHGWQGGVKGFSGVLPETANSSKFAAAARLEQLNEQMKYLQSYALDGAGKDGLFEVQELEQMMKGYGKPGYTIDPRLSYVAQQYGLSPLEVLNRQLKANNMELPPPPPSQEIINKLTPEQQRLLNTTPTVERSQRGMTGVTEFNGALLPSRAQPYASLIQQSAQKHGIDPAVMAGMLETESGWIPAVINGTRLSSAGAKGIAQFMPATAADYGVNPTDPASAIDGMARYMKDLLRMFNGDYRLAVTAYNAGQGNVMRYGGPIPGNAESQGYWPKVLKSAGKYGYGAQTLRDPAVMRPSSPVAGLAPLNLAAMGTTTTPINN